MADMMNEQSWSALKEDLKTFLNGFKPLFRKQVAAVEEAKNRLNERHLSKEILDKAYAEIQKEVQATSAKKLYESIEKHLTLTASTDAAPAAPEKKDITPPASTVFEDIQKQDEGPKGEKPQATPKKPKQDEKPAQQPQETTPKKPSLVKDIQDYLYNKETTDYSDFVGDYIEGSGLDAAAKKEHLLKVVGILEKEFNKRHDKETTPVWPDKQKIAAMAVIIHGVNRQAKAAEVDEAVKGLFAQMSKSARLRHLKKIKKEGYLNQQGKPQNDYFLRDLREISNKGNKPFIAEIAAAHVSAMMDNLDNDGKKYYIELLKSKYKAYLPEEAKKQGGKKMTEDEVIDPEVVEETTPKPEAHEGPEAGGAPEAHDDKPKEETAAEFEPKGVLLKACYIAGIDWKGKGEGDIKDAVASAGYIIDGDKILVKDNTADDKPLSDEAKKAKEEKIEATEKAFEGKETLNDEESAALKKELEEIDKKHAVNVFGAEQEQPTDQNTDWIARKRAQYERFSADGTIANYSENQVENGFGASFDGGKITYTAENNVTVDPSSKIKAFEAILQEDDNKGRPINFADNMTPEMKARLFAACTLHGNPMVGALPSAEEMMQYQDMLKAELGDARYAEFTAKIRGGQEQSGAENPQPEQHREEDSSKFSQEDTDKIKKALEDQYDLAQMQKDGVVKVSYEGEGENRKMIFEAGKTKDADGKEVETSAETVDRFKDIYLKSESDKKFLAEKFKENPAEFKQILGDLVREASNKEVKTLGDVATKKDKEVETFTPKDDAAAAKIAALREARKDIIKANMTPEQAAAREKKMDDRDKVLAARLGIIPEAYSTAPTKEGEAPKKIGKDKDNGDALRTKLGKETVDRLTAKFSKGGNDSR